LKLHILSDLHHEFAPGEPPPIEAVGADVIVLAGDIDVGIRGVRWSMRESHRLGKPMIYVPGNHEYYGHVYPCALNQMRQEASGTSVRVLDREVATLDGVRFLGVTLWTDFCLTGRERQAAAMAAAEEQMPDYRCIRLLPSLRTLRAQDTVRLHEEARHWLQQRLAERFAGPTVVVSHTAPSVWSRNPAYDVDLFSAAFLSDLECLMDGKQVDLWIHGHTHACVRYAIGGTRVVSNQRGYTRLESVGFDPGYTVTL
jgi:predicted phosphodiesterase